MDTILQNGINFILAFQALGGWLEIPMKFFTFLGSEEFFLLILPALYWSIDAGLGARVAAMLLVSGGLNTTLKLAFHGPRPYWVSAQVKALAMEPSFGVPSGHSQIAAGVWGALAAYIKRPWAWALAIAIVLMIGLSRLYLGVHFPHDVLLGWLLGALTLWLYLRYWDRLTAWLKQQNLGMQVGLAFALSLLALVSGWLALLSLQGWVFPAAWMENIAKAGPGQLPAPASLNDTLSSAGVLFGLLAGLAWTASRGGYAADGTGRQRVARYFLGLVGILVFWLGLKAILPDGPEIVPAALRYIRYALIGGWISAGAPYIFIRLRLAQKPA